MLLSQLKNELVSTSTETTKIIKRNKNYSLLSIKGHVTYTYKKPSQKLHTLARLKVNYMDLFKRKIFFNETVFNMPCTIIKGVRT